MSDHAASNVIFFPLHREKSLGTLRDAVWTLDQSNLSRIGILLAQLVDDAVHEADEAQFYERTKTAYALFERILIEGDRL